MTFHIQTDVLGSVLERVRQRKPVVHAITNWVTAGDVASALHALGARPILAFAREEVAEVTSKADALMLNLGTPNPDRVEAMLLAGIQANRDQKPVVFDPVGAGISKFRTEAALRVLCELRVSIVKGNSAEIGSLAGMGGQLRGIDTIGGPEDLPGAAAALGHRTGAVVAVSGERDLIVKGEERVWVENGHPLMARVTGAGCMLAAVMASFLAVENDLLMAGAAGMAFFGLAGEYAGRRTKRPGSYRAALLDALFTLTPGDLRGGARCRK